jgi:hypothetical protein
MGRGKRVVCGGMRKVIQCCKARGHFGVTDLAPKLILCHTMTCDRDENLSGYAKVKGYTKSISLAVNCSTTNGLKNKP